MLCWGRLLWNLGCCDYLSEVFEHKSAINPTNPLALPVIAVIGTVLYSYPLALRKVGSLSLAINVRYLANCLNRAPRVYSRDLE